MAKGRLTGGGTRKGIPNKATAEIKALAQQYAPAAMKELARLFKNAKSEQARVAAIGMLLDRAYGKSPQVIAGDRDNPLSVVITSEESEL